MVGWPWPATKTSPSHLLSLLSAGWGREINKKKKKNCGLKSKQFNNWREKENEKWIRESTRHGKEMKGKDRKKDGE